MAQEKLISLNNLSTFKDNVDVLLSNKDAYGVCSTAANVAAKTVSYSTFVLASGVSISVKFENSNTAENPTLNVNNTGAKAIYRFDTIRVGTTEESSWKAGSIVTLLYDGTNWLMSDVQEGTVYNTITYAEWLNMTPQERAAENYYIPDYPGASVTAVGVSYDNTSSGLSASNVQAAIDELSGDISTVTYDLSVGTGDDANKIILIGSDSSVDKVTVPYAVNAGTVNGKTVAVNVPADAVFTDTTYESKSAASGGSDVSLVTTGEKYTWNNKSDFSGNYSDLIGTPTLGTASEKDVATSGDASSTQVVMGNDSRLTDARNAADVYDWAKASTKPSYNASEVGAIATTAKGTANGVAELDGNGKVPSSQLPSYVDDVLEYDSISDFPLSGETGKIYIAKDTNKTYRWSGSGYVEISESLALGETSSTAYAGNKGKANADAIAAIKDGSAIDSFSDVETALATKQDDVGLSVVNGKLCITYSTT